MKENDPSCGRTPNELVALINITTLQMVFYIPKRHWK